MAWSVTNFATSTTEGIRSSRSMQEGDVARLAPCGSQHAEVDARVLRALEYLLNACG